MLARLQIENFAIIDSVGLEFGPGFNVITGETGAGKSILLGALELALGDRARGDLLREGKRVASVEAIFAPPFPLQLAELIRDDLGLEWEPGEELVIRREITSSGRNRCLIAEQMVNVADLRRAGELLADLHGQHEHQSLFRTSAQRGVLDDHAGNGKLLEEYRAAWDELAALRARKAELAAASGESERRRDYLEFQIQELDELSPVARELTVLEAEESRLAHAESLATEAAAAYAVLYEGGDDDAPTVTSALGEIGRRTDEIAGLDPSAAGLSEKVSEIRALADDLASELRDYLARCEPDPGRLDEVVTRIEEYRRLMRKHGVRSEDELAGIADKMRAERDRIETDDRERGEVDARLKSAEAAARKLAGRLTSAREKGAAGLRSAVLKTLARVGMEKAEFSVRITAKEELGADGADAIEFLLAANPGMPARPLRQTASGGELSRTMLAIKAATAAKDAVPTLVFDEIDAGISGRVAASVGGVMERLAGSHQILCITHHASIAARGATHMSVRKTSSRGKTKVEVLALDRELRIEELATMIGDDGKSSAGRTMAEKLLAAS